MKRPPVSATPAAQAGIAAVELALILPVMLIMMFAVLQFGRIFWQYDALQKAVANAANFLAMMPATDMEDLSKATAARSQAQQMVVDAATDASVSPALDSAAVVVYFWCGASGDTPCAYSSSPASQVTKVSVGIDLPLTDDGIFNFGPAWSAWLGGTTLHAGSTMPVTN